MGYSDSHQKEQGRIYPDFTNIFEESSDSSSSLQGGERWVHTHPSPWSCITIMATEMDMEAIFISSAFDNVYIQSNNIHGLTGSRSTHMK